MIVARVLQMVRARGHLLWRGVSDLKRGLQIKISSHHIHRMAQSKTLLFSLHLGD